MEINVTKTAHMGQWKIQNTNNELLKQQKYEIESIWNKTIEL